MLIQSLLKSNKAWLNLFDLQKLQEISEKEEPTKEDLQYILRLKLRSQE